MTKNSNDVFQLPIADLSKDHKKTLIKIPLGELPENEFLLSPAPTKEFLEDIAARGQTDPISVTRDQQGRYVVIAGRRRIKAIRILHKEYPDRFNTVDAILIADIDEDSYFGLTAVENNLRTDNPLTDFAAIEHIEKSYPGISDQEISRQTGIPISRIKKRRKLNNLVPMILDQVKSNKININVAENIAKLAPKKQDILLNKFISKGKLTQDDVIEVQRATVQSSADTLPAFPDLDIKEEKPIAYCVISDDLKVSCVCVKIEDAETYKELQDNSDKYQICKIIAI